MSVEAMKQALDKFEHLWEIGIDAEYKVELLPEIKALRQAIEQAEKQEPFGYFQLDLRMDAWVQNRDNKKGVPFYTAPPRKEWVSLSDDQMNECIKTADYNQGQYKRTPYWAHLAAAIEAKLKERNT
jgi:hypothetical protein